MEEDGGRWMSGVEETEHKEQIRTITLNNLREM